MERSCKDLQTIKVRNEVTRKKMGVRQSVLERIENNMLKWYGHVLGMAVTDGRSE
jgi:hypothetical protein